MFLLILGGTSVLGEAAPLGFMPADGRSEAPCVWLGDASWTGLVSVESVRGSSPYVAYLPPSSGFVTVYADRAYAGRCLVRMSLFHLPPSSGDASMLEVVSRLSVGYQSVVCFHYFWGPLFWSRVRYHRQESICSVIHLRFRV